MPTGWVHQIRGQRENGAALNFFVFYLTDETDDPEYYFALFDVDEDEIGV